MARRTTAKKRSFSYKKRDYSNARKRAEQSASTRDAYVNEELSMFKPIEGENLIRILPPSWENPEHYGYDIYVHYNVGADNAAYLCPLKNKGEPCPICEERENAEGEGDTEYAKKLKPTKRVLFYLVDRDKETDGMKAWAAPWTIDKEIAIQATDSRNREFFPVDDPEEGYDVTITRTGTGTNTKYSISIARRSSDIELTDDIIETLETMPCPDALVFYDYDHIEKVFAGTVAAHEHDDDDKGKDDDKKPASKSRASKPKQNELPTEKEVLGMQGQELDEIVDEFGLDLDPASFGSDEELAEAICEALNLTTKPEEQEEEEQEEEEQEEEEQEEEEKEDAGKSKVRSRLAGIRSRSGKK